MSQVRFARPVLLVLLASAVALAGCTAAGTGGAGGGGGGELRVAVAGPFSGDAAQYGQDFFRGAGLAADQINANGGVGGKQIKLLQFDDRNDTTEAANVAQKIASDPSIVASMGHFTSSTVYATMPIYKANQIPLVVISASDPKITQQGNEWLFRVSPTNNLGAEAMADLMVKQYGLKKLASFYLNTDFGKSEHGYWVDQVKKDGGEVVLEEGYQPDAKDFTASIIKLKNSGADGVYLSSYYNDAALLIKQAKAAGVEQKWFSSGSVISPQFPEIGGSAVEGVMTDRIAQGQAWDEIGATYKQKYNQEASPFVIYAYSALQAIGEAAKNGATRQGVRDNLPKLKDLATPLGPLSFNADRQVVYSNFDYMVVQDGAFQPKKP
jgi:branched-chain amino acid transport system substrate-binding protein